MANVKITELTDIGTPASDDVLEIVDISTNTSKKVQVSALGGGATPTLAEVLNVGGREVKIVDTTLGNYTLLASDINKILYLGGDVVIDVVINSGLTLNYGDEFIICNGQSIDNVNFDVTAISNGTNFNPILPFYKAVVTFLNDGASGFYSVFYETDGLNSGGGATDLGYTPSPTNGIVTSSTGTDATLPLADATDAGLLKPADFTQLSTLVTDLASKVDENTAITGATKTKITYDAKGLVTAGADATKSDVGLGNVDNTSDANKPISTATQTALDLRTRELLQDFTDYTTTAVLTEQIISNQAISANDMKINSWLNFIATLSRTGTTNATVSIYLNTTSNSLSGAVKIATATITSTQSLPCFKRDYSINASSVLRGVLFTANIVTDEIATQAQSTTTLTLGSTYYLITTVQLNNVADTVTQRAINLKSSK